MMEQIRMELPIRNQWPNVERLRQAVLGSLSAVVEDPDECHAVATVIGELLENAIKYGAWKAPGEEFLRLTLAGESGTLKVIVENPVDPGGEDVARLRNTLKWLAAFEDPAEAYQRRLCELAEQPGSSSRLGLVRVVYEGNCRLDLEVSGSTLRMVGAIALA